MKPDPQIILKDAARLKTEKYSKYFADLAARRKYRFREMGPVIPLAYRDTATEHRSDEISDQGRAAMALIYAIPVLHIPPPSPELQAITTKGEVFFGAALQELEAAYGTVTVKNVQAQLHDKFSWIFFGMKRKPYAKQPKPYEDNATEDEKLAWGVKNAAYKKEAGIASVFDLRHVPTDTVLCVGDERNPLEIYEVKDVDERELIAKFKLRKDGEGKLQLPPEETTLPSGTPTMSGQSGEARKLTVVEYWDREWCMIVAENAGQWGTSDPLVLDSWNHNWGRVPYFGAPAFENEVLAIEHKWESPLDGLYAEIPEYNNRRTMFSNVSHLKSYPSWQDVSGKDADTAVDSDGKPRTTIKYQPGQVYYTDPGHEIKTIPMDTGNELLQELMAFEARIQKYGLAEIAKGISPGADTANSSLTQLRRLQRSALSPLTQNEANQWREIAKFMFMRIKGEEGEGIGETVYVYSEDAGEMIDLSPEEIVTLNFQCKVEPDVGQDNLIEEKQAADLFKGGLISEMEFHERRGKEAPEQFVRANIIQRALMQIEPQLIQQAMANIGSVQAQQQIADALQQGKTAQETIPNIMKQVADLQSAQPTGMGSGSPDMGRSMGVRSPAIAETTQPAMNGAQNAPG